MAGRARLLSFGLPLAALLALGGATYSIVANTPDRPPAEPLYAPPAAPPARGGSGHGFVGAVGIVEPASEEIRVGTHVSGVVRKVLVRSGDAVREGDPLFVVDDRAAAAEAASRRRELALAEAKLAELRATIPTARARVAAAEAGVRQLRAELGEQQDRYSRARQLVQSRAVAAEDLQARRFAVESTAAKVAAAEAHAAAARADLALLADGDEPASIRVRQAEVEKARAALDLAETQLELHTARAPVTGAVLQVKVRPGEFAQSAVLSQALVVVGRTDPLHVRVSIDEADIPRFDEAAPAFASPRGAAGARTPLEFVRLESLVVPKRSLTGVMSERVDTRVLEVIYALPRGAGEFRPGQQVDVYLEARPTHAGPDALAGRR